MATQKYEIINFVPNDVLSIILKYFLKEESIINQGIIALTCSLFYELIENSHRRPKVVECYATGNQMKLDRLFTMDTKLHFFPSIENVAYFVPKLVECSVGANQEQMQRLLTLYPGLASKKHVFTDWSNRTFNCSVFEYAFWSKDVKYMCPMILDCLPQNAQGEAIRVELHNQAKALLAEGLSYQIKDKQYQEKFFSLEPLKLALTTYIDNFDGWDWPARDKHWCTVVGAEQLLLTAYIRQHYCDPEESFYPTPTFTKEQFTRSLKFINWARNGVEQSWGYGLIGLGVDFAMGGGHGGRRAGRWLTPARVRFDLAAITALDKVRTETDLPLFMQRLEIPLQEPDMSSEYQSVIP